MRKFNILAAILLTAAFAFSANAQGKERFSGTLLYYGSGADTRTVTTTFTLDITGETSDSQAQSFLGILKNDGQKKLLDAIDDSENGRFSVGPNIGIPVNVVRETTADGDRRIFVVFKRWTQFAELRYGYRSVDYPFGVIELRIDNRTGKGEGTYIAAARIRWDSDAKNNIAQVEIENFATFPAKLLSVTSNRQRQ